LAINCRIKSANPKKTRHSIIFFLLSKWNTMPRTKRKPRKSGGPPSKRAKMVKDKSLTQEEAQWSCTVPGCDKKIDKPCSKCGKAACSNHDGPGSGTCVGCHTKDVCADCRYSQACCDDTTHFKCQLCNTPGDDYCGGQCPVCKKNACENCLVFFNDEIDDDMYHHGRWCYKCIVHSRYTKCPGCYRWLNLCTEERKMAAISKHCTCPFTYYCSGCVDRADCCTECLKKCPRCGKQSRICHHCDYCGGVMCAAECEIAIHMGGRDYAVCREKCRQKIIPQIEEDMESERKWAEEHQSD